MERQGEKKGGIPNIAMWNHRVRPLPYPRETLMSPSPPPHKPQGPIKTYEKLYILCQTTLQTFHSGGFKYVSPILLLI